jgi:PEP-CTERM motif-containing protein
MRILGLFRLWSVVATAFLVASTSSAAILYDQPGSNDACASTCWTSTVDSSGAGFQTFDNFVLPQASIVQSVEWQGFYWDFVVPGNNPVAPSTVSWELSFSADNASLPGAVLFTETFAAAGVTATFLGNSTFSGDSVPVYRFHADLTAPFLAAAGTPYWFSPLSEQTDFNPLFSWSPALLLVDNLTVQFVRPGSVAFNRPDDRNFQLEGVAAVPEPGVLALFSVALAGLGWMKRRQR